MESNTLLAAGMLSGKSTVNYVYYSDGKSKIFMNSLDRFGQEYFPLATVCKTSVQSMGYGNILSGSNVSHGGVSPEAGER